MLSTKTEWVQLDEGGAISAQHHSVLFELGIAAKASQGTWSNSAVLGY